MISIPPPLLNPPGFDSAHLYFVLCTLQSSLLEALQKVGDGNDLSTDAVKGDDSLVGHKHCKVIKDSSYACNTLRTLLSLNSFVCLFFVA